MNKKFTYFSLSSLAISISFLATAVTVLSCSKTKEEVNDGTQNDGEANDGEVSTIKDFVFDNEGSITKYVGKAKNVIIPNYIQNDEGIFIKITRIDDYSFRDTQITQVTIPDSVTSIGIYAFYGTELTQVTIPDSVTSIAAYAFRDTKITQVTLPKNCKFRTSCFPSGCKVTGGIINY